jgi:hypothetical protein
MAGIKLTAEQYSLIGEQAAIATFGGEYSDPAEVLALYEEAEPHVALIRQLQAGEVTSLGLLREHAEALLREEKEIAEGDRDSLAKLRDGDMSRRIVGQTPKESESTWQRQIDCALKNAAVAESVLGLLGAEVPA